jgi:hypothetical protein
MKPVFTISKPDKGTTSKTRELSTISLMKLYAKILNKILKIEFKNTSKRSYIMVKSVSF